MKPRIAAKPDEIAGAATVLRADIDTLSGRSGYRLRVGDWRVIFDYGHETLVVLDLGPRGDIYWWASQPFK